MRKSMAGRGKTLKAPREEPGLTSVLTKRVVPKDLNGIDGVSSGFNAPSVYESRIVVMGQPGSGKSTFLHSCDRAMILDPENGGRTVEDPQALRFKPPISVPKEKLDLAYLEFVDQLIRRRRSGKDDILVLGIDTIDKLITVFLDAICARAGTEDPLAIDGGSGNGYTKARKDIWGMLEQAYNAGFGWILLAHTAVDTINVGESTRQIVVPSVTRSFRAPLLQECEHMLFVERGTIVRREAGATRIIKGKKHVGRSTSTSEEVRQLKTAPGGVAGGGSTNDVKVRLPLPDQIILPATNGYGAFTSAYDAAVARRIGRRPNHAEDQE